MVKEKSGSNRKKTINLSERSLESISKYLSYITDLDIKVEKLEYVRRDASKRKDVDEVIDLYIRTKNDEKW